MAPIVYVTGAMLRKDLIELLCREPHSVAELARLLETTPADVEDDLRHLLRSLRNLPYRALITPARCRHCGFTFHRDKLTKPSKCPQCRHTWIREPRVGLEPAD